MFSSDGGVRENRKYLLSQNISIFFSQSLRNQTLIWGLFTTVISSSDICPLSHRLSPVPMLRANDRSRMFIQVLAGGEGPGPFDQDRVFPLDIYPQPARLWSAITTLASLNTLQHRKRNSVGAAGRWDPRGWSLDKSY